MEAYRRKTGARFPTCGDNANKSCPQEVTVLIGIVKTLTYVPTAAGTTLSTKDKVSPTDLKAFAQQLSNCPEGSQCLTGC